MRRFGGLALALIAASAVACSGPKPPPFKPVVDNKALMASVLEKQANIIWESVGEIDTATGTQELRPRTDEEWANIRDAAVTVTEAGNLLMLVPRAQDADQWMQFASALIAEGERMITAIDRKNPKEVFDVGADMYEACVHCHTNYMPGVKEMYKR
jgi:hypothetical protein